MFENLYTTRMSEDAETIKNRFFKIQTKAGKTARITGVISFLAVLFVIACVSIVIAVNTRDNYAMTEEEFSDYINHPIGAIMADLDYVDDKKLVFHYGDGFFVINRQTNEIQFMMSLPKFNASQHQQGSNVLEVKVDKDGKYAYLSSIGQADEIKEFEEYIINLDNGKVEKGTIPEDAELFAGVADTFTTLQNPVGWYSNNCIVTGDRTYYLTLQDSIVAAIQLVAVNHNENNNISMSYVFGENYVSLAQFKANLINASLTEGEEILVNSGLNWEVNEDKVNQVIDKLSESRQVKYRDIKEGNYEISIYQIWSNETSSPRLFIIDNYELELVFSAELEKPAYSEITNILNQPENSEIVLRNFFNAFEESDFEGMKLLSTDELPIDEGYKMCYGMTRADLHSIQDTDIDEFLKNYLARPKQTQIKFSDEEIELLKNRSDKLKVYTVTVLAESNIKGEIKPSYYNTFEVVCEMQENGDYLVHKFVN